MGYLIGMDIGGTNIKIGLYSIASNSVIDFLTMKAKRCDSIYMEVEQNICYVIKDMMKRHMLNTEELKGIGISIAANFEPATGRLTSWPNNSKWNGFPIKEYLIQYFNVPVILEDDANSAAFGEFIYKYNHNDSLIYCTIGTGIGMGIIIDKKIYRGRHHMAGELGHMKIYGNREKCVCGDRGCLQAVFQAEKDQNSLNIRCQKDLDNIGRLARRIAYCLYQMAYLLDISVTVVGGGAIEHNIQFFRRIEQHFYSYMGKKAYLYSIKKSDLYNKNGVYGALELVSEAINTDKCM